jgi:dTDP-glucose 4,6-dehydratase
MDHVLEHTRDLWESVRGRRIFMTGGTGFVGTWLLESFLLANEQFDLRASILVLSRDPDAFLRRAPQFSKLSALDFVRGSSSSFSYPNGEFAYIIHAATEQGAPPSKLCPLGPFDENVTGTRRVLEFARHCAAKRVLLTSSGAVYGSQPAHVEGLSEEDSFGPLTTDGATAYGHSKRISEFIGSAYSAAYGFDVLIARLFAFVGPMLPLDLNFAVGNFIRDALKGGPIHVSGDGSPLRSYLYASDLAIWLWTICFKGQSVRPYNVGGSEAISIAQLASIVRQNVGVPDSIDIQIANAPKFGAPPKRYVPSTSRARVELGLVPRVSLADGIRRTAAWYQADRRHRPVVMS